MKALVTFSSVICLKIADPEARCCSRLFAPTMLHENLKIARQSFRAACRKNTSRELRRFSVKLGASRWAELGREAGLLGRGAALSVPLAVDCVAVVGSLGCPAGLRGLLSLALGLATTLAGFLDVLTFASFPDSTGMVGPADCWLSGLAVS